MTERPDFSGVAREYAAIRPGYPAELFAWLAEHAPARDAAWDVATGSGQAAIGLAEHFAHVFATDVSAKQLEHARAHPRIEYRVAPAEASGLAEDSVDLVTAAASVHWFELDRFGPEVGRVLRPGGLLAVWTYHVAQLSAPLDRIFDRFYRDVLRPYFAPRARMVDHGYADLALPGVEVGAPAFAATVRWDAPQALAFARTWSGVQAFREREGRDPVDDIEAEVTRAFGGESHEIRLPLYLRVMRLD